LKANAKERRPKVEKGRKKEKYEGFPGPGGNFVAPGKNGQKVVKKVS
jgi:hypothetical protein